MMNADNITERLIITPLLDEDEQVGPGSVYLRLGTEFIETSRRTAAQIDPLTNEMVGTGSARPDSKTFVPLADGFVLHPGQLVLGCTLEFLQLPANVPGQVVSRSSWGRLGLLVATAVAVQPGFKGVLTLELVNTGNAPIVLRPGVRVAQLLLWEAHEPTAQPYGGGRSKYAAPLGPETNRLGWESSERERLEKIADEMQSRSTFRGRGRHVAPNSPTSESTKA